MRLILLFNPNPPYSAFFSGSAAVSGLRCLAIVADAHRRFRFPSRVQSARAGFFLGYSPVLLLYFA